jgi:hypothetical protein
VRIMPPQLAHTAKKKKKKKKKKRKKKKKKCFWCAAQSEHAKRMKAQQPRQSNTRTRQYRPLGDTSATTSLCSPPPPPASARAATVAGGTFLLILCHNSNRISQCDSVDVVEIKCFLLFLLPIARCFSIVFFPESSAFLLFFPHIDIAKKKKKKKKKKKN